MRALLIAAVVVLLMVVVGWVSFAVTEDRSTINLETDKIERDLESFKESVDEVGDEIADETDGDSATN